jgi:NSS family neurotransmitter:Na+ symporter
MTEPREAFTSRWGLLVTILGMAVGTGNIWRFPRIFAVNQGGAFLIPWLIFLFAWSIPILIVEMGMGKKARLGLIGAFGKLIGRGAGWLGGFVAVVTMFIMFYYSVVTGWCLRYLLEAFRGGTERLTDPEVASQAFESFATSGMAVPFHFVAIGIGAWFIYRGVVAGIERANRFLIPFLAVLLVVAAARALTLPGAERGLEFMFHIDWSLLANHRIWLEGLTQSAWSTGAGWGLLLTYAVYTRQKEDTVFNSVLVGLGNNSISLLAALAVLPTVFASFATFEEAHAVATYSGPASTGLSFVWIPILLSKLPFGNLLAICFFLSLSAAALSSLIAMLELCTRILIDLGLSRGRAILVVWAGGFLGGLPSAISLGFFSNQDWVWSLGLMISGGLFTFAAIRYGLTRLREQLVNLPGNEMNLGTWFNWVLGILVPVEFVVLFTWWVVQSFDFARQWWNPFSTYSLASCMLQWALVVVLLLALNRWLTGRTLGLHSASGEEGGG